MNIKEFFEKHGDVLKKKALVKLRPLSNIEGGEMDKVDESNIRKLAELSRKPFYAQATTINSLAKAFYTAERKSLILVGEMGTGKTLIGAAVAYLNPKKAHRTLILCPPHLVRKWEREILLTVPGAKVRCLKTVEDVDLAEPRGCEFWILSREKAKLHYKDIMAVAKNSKGYHCQHCGKPLVIKSDKDGNLRLDKDEYDKVKKGSTKCPHCKAVLKQPTLEFRRYAVAKYIKQHKKNCCIDLLIADEMHELKGGATAQGDAFHALCTASRKVLGMTGTLMGGYSSNLFYLLFRMFPRKMVEQGYKHSSSTEFCKRYGILETQITNRERGTDRVASLGKDSGSVKSAPREKPGVSPVLLPHFLLEDSVFLFIDDIATSMPSYTEHIEIINMDDEQYKIYKDFEYQLINLVRTTSRGGGASRFLGALVQSLYALPDGVRKGEKVYDPRSPDPNNPVVALEAPALDIPMTAKEERLIEIVQEERTQGRRCCVFLEHTGTRDLIPDLVERLEKEGLTTLVLRSGVETDKREEWIARAVEEKNPDVFITNPNNVKTGLDLLEFPTIIYFQSGYNIYTLRQSSRRSWRIGQAHPVKVYYLAYDCTAQERALKLIAQKLETSNAVEGKLSADGLSAMSETQNSMLYELARSIMEGNKDKTSVAEAWGKKAEAEKASGGLLVTGSADSLRDKVMELLNTSKRKLGHAPNILTLENYFSDEEIVDAPKITITPKPEAKPKVSAEMEDKAMEAGMKGKAIKGNTAYKVFDLAAYFDALEEESA
jgi:SNF2 family DNA or RNA helicase